MESQGLTKPPKYKTVQQGGAYQKTEEPQLCVVYILAYTNFVAKLALLPSDLFPPHPLHPPFTPDPAPSVLKPAGRARPAGRTRPAPSVRLYQPTKPLIFLRLCWTFVGVHPVVVLLKG